jgi:general stress protein CsbA
LLGTILLTVSGSYVRSNQYKQLLVIVSVSIIFVLAGYLYRDRLLKRLRKKK